MPAPVKKRRIRDPPAWIDPEQEIVYFKPARIPLRDLDQVILSHVEVDCLRYADLEDANQVDAGEKMGISQPSFSRHLKLAHQKVADAIINGKALKIEGGHYPVISIRTFKCKNCDQSWELPFGTGRPEKCPECSSTDFYRVT
ncbi:MAG: DUF134 domain-containing protein [Candidatus Odinarchaeota archaeon]